MRYNAAIRQLGQTVAQKDPATAIRDPEVVFAMDCPRLDCHGRLFLECETKWTEGFAEYRGWYLVCEKCKRMVLVQQFPGEEAF